MLSLTDECKQSFSQEIIVFSISLIISLVTTVIAVTTFYRIIQRHKSVNQFPWPLFLAQIVLYMFSVFYTLSELIGHAMHCFMSSETQQLSLRIVQISPGIFYLIHWISLLFILFYRLYYSFIGTVLALSKLYIYTFILSLCILFLGILTPMIFHSMSIWNNAIFATALFLAIIVSQYVSFTYNYKLLYLHIVCR